MRLLKLIPILALAGMVWSCGLRNNPLVPENGHPPDNPPQDCTPFTIWKPFATRCVYLTPKHPTDRISRETVVSNGVRDTFQVRIWIDFSEPSGQDFQVAFVGIEGTTGMYFMQETWGDDWIRQTSKHDREATLRITNVPAGRYEVRVLDHIHDCDHLGVCPRDNYLLRGSPGC